jgi:uncharacterized protein (DUF1697 family)
MPARTRPAKAHVALLRGINLAGKNRVAMTTLCAFFVEAGCDDVAAYIQSGNVVFTAAPELAARLPELIQKRLAGDLGLTVPLVTRTRDELAAIVAGNPFLAEGVDPALLHVSFLAGTPTKTSIAGLDPQRSPPDRFVVRGREIYLCLPNGAGRTKLSNDFFDRRLGTVSTARNWRTVGKLLALADARG